MNIFCYTHLFGKPCNTFMNVNCMVAVVDLAIVAAVHVNVVSKSGHMCMQAVLQYVHERT